MPQCFSVACIQGQKVAVSVPRKGNAGICSQDTGSGAAWSKFMAPSYFAGLVVNGLDYALTPNAIVGAGPAIYAVGGLGEVDAPAWMGVNNEQSGLRIEAG